MGLSNKENIWILGEKEKYKCFGILEANNIKQMKMNEKILKAISEERENFSKANSVTEIKSKG